MPWVEAARGVMEAQCRDIEYLQIGLQDARDATQAARHKATVVWKDVEARLLHL